MEYNNKPPSPRQTKYDQARDLLKQTGYWSCKMHIPRIAIFYMLMICINQLAHFTRRKPDKVYDHVYLLYRLALKGSMFSPCMLKLSRFKALVEACNVEDGFQPMRCPHCGRDLGALPSPDNWDHSDDEVPTVSPTIDNK